MISRQPGWRFPLPCSERRTGGANQARRSLWGRRRREASSTLQKDRRMMMMIMAVLGAGRRGEIQISCTCRLEELLHHFVLRGEGAQLQILSPRLEVPRPALRGGEVKPGEEEPGGKEDGAHITFHVEPLLLLEFLGFVSLCSYFD